MTGDSYALSPMQQGMLFQHLKEQHVGIDIEQLVVHTPDVIDAERMRAAWAWLVSRHDVLRTRFEWEAVDEPRQHVEPRVSVPFDVTEGGDLPEHRRRELLNAFLKRDRRRGFELDVAPLLRLTLFQWQTSSSLVWTFHHALIDGRCLPVLLAEVFQAYEELAEGDVAARPAPPAYRQYIDWLQRRDPSTAESFWHDYLAGITAPTPLVVDRLGPPVGAGDRQGETWHVLDAALTCRLHAVARDHGVTLNAVVMAAWAILLHRYSSEDDVLFGATRACRQSSIADAPRTIGLFINTVPVRARLHGDVPVSVVMAQMRHDWVAMRPFEHAPLARVKALAAIPASQPLFETLLVFENYGLDTVMRSQGGAWAGRRIELHELTNVPLTLAAYDGGQLSFKAEFDRSRLDDATVGRTLGHLHTVLDAIASNPAAPVCDLPLLTEAERVQIVEEFNRPRTSPGTTAIPADGSALLHELFEAQVRRSPTAVAVTCDGQSMSYAELNAAADRVAGALIARGAAPDTLVGLAVGRTTRLVIGILGILKAGAAYLPVDQAYPPERVTFILGDAGVRLLIADRGQAPSLGSADMEVVCLEDVLESAAPAAVPAPSRRAGPDDLAYAIYTSGTTGKPKGSLITHRNVVRLFSATDPWFGFHDRDVWTLFHSCAFDFSVWELWGALLYGGRLVVVPFLVSRSPEAFRELLVTEGVTVLNQTPSAFRQLMQADEAATTGLLRLRYVIFGGEALEMQSLRSWFDRHGDERPRLINMYGITETTVHVTYRPLAMADVQAGSVIGVPIPDLRIHILDPAGHPVPIGVPGEMYVGGAGLARGYLRRPELTTEHFVPDHISGLAHERLYRTGDLARFLPTQDIEYLGRIDHQVKIRGFRIELGEIESVLCQRDDVREAVVLAREDEPGSKRLVAYVVPTRSSVQVDALRAHLATLLPQYMVPAAFVLLEALPLTTNGKVDRKALPVPDPIRPDLASQYVAPRTVIERQLAAVWSKVLRVAEVGVHDNFFALGGDSILSIQAIALARRDGLKITPKLLFQYQTIAELAAAPDLATVDDSAPENAPASGDVPLTPIQKWFFEQDLAEPHHYNQSFLFEVQAPLERPFLERALAAVAAHHDAMRLRFARDHAQVRQFQDAVDAPVALTWIDIADLSEQSRSAAVEAAGSATQGALDLEKGPIWAAVYFDAGPTQRGRLLLVVHHLAIDGVSWRPLLEDLSTAYRQVSARSPVRLPARTSSFKTWAHRLHEYAASGLSRGERDYWAAIGAVGIGADPDRGRIRSRDPKNTEGASRSLEVALEAGETRELLEQVPAAYGSRINDVLLAALSVAWTRCTGNPDLVLSLEGHGREPIFDDVDLSRTVGWFTSIFPVWLKSGAPPDLWEPAAAVRSVRETLRAIPHHGIGYGLLRYLADDTAVRQAGDPDVLFNYLGQFDRGFDDADLFRITDEFTGAWHSARQIRRYALEINCLVTAGRLHARWTYCEDLHSRDAVSQLTEEFLRALRAIVAHASTRSSLEAADSRFAIADRATSPREQDDDHVEDTYPLSPTQLLFYSANPGPALQAFDHWHCTLVGQLDVEAFRGAWNETLRRQPVLRSTFHSGDGSEPLQAVHRDVRPDWSIHDWRDLSVEQRAVRWSEWLQADAATPLDLTRAPVMRFTLARVGDDAWRFLWTAPPLLLDGWSWPLVFRDVSRAYASLSAGASPNLEPVPTYRAYLEWLRDRPSAEASQFWRAQLDGLTTPTILTAKRPSSGDVTGRFVSHSSELSSEQTEALPRIARHLRLTVGTLLQGAWALVLARESGDDDVLFGTAFAGRPPDLPEAEAIVGPLVNTLPIRAFVDPQQTLREFLTGLHARLLDVSVHQFLPLMEIQRCSDVPWRHRLFESVVVYQNYLVEEAARRLGDSVEIADFVGPIHTNYPVMLVGYPGNELRLTLIRDPRVVAGATAEQWLRDVALLLSRLPDLLDQRLAEVQEQLAPVASAVQFAPASDAPRPSNVIAPQTSVERTIADVWAEMFALDSVGIDQNFFDLGGHSLLLVQTHARLRTALQADFPIVAMFQHPTVRSLARHFSAPVEAAPDRDLQDRAERQRASLAQLRAKMKRTRQ